MSIIIDVIKTAALLTKIALSAGTPEKKNAQAAAPAPPQSSPKTFSPPECIEDRKNCLRLELNETGSEYRAVVTEIQTQDIIIPDSYDGFPVTEIKLRCYGTYYGNKSRLFVPKTVKKLDVNVVLRSKGNPGKIGRWIKIIIDEKNPYFVTENRCVYSKDMTILWVAQCKTNFFTVPDTVTAIADHAFTGNQNIVEVKLPPSVKTIGEGAFEDCGNLRKINVENVVSIGKGAFRECEKIRVFICEKLRWIGGYCFGSHNYFNFCCLDTVKLPAALESVGEDVFPRVRSITFYDDLKAPLRSFVKNPYYVTVRSAESGEIKFKVCIDSDAPKIIQERYLLGWKEYAKFNFEEFDRLFKIHCSRDQSARRFFSAAARLRLGYPYKLSESAREYYIKYLTDNPIPIDQCLHGECDTADFSALFKEKIKGVPDIAELIDILDALPGNEKKSKEFGLGANKASELKENIFPMIEEFCRDGIYGVEDLFELINNFTANGKTEYTARIMAIRNSIFPYSLNGGLELE